MVHRHGPPVSIREGNDASAPRDHPPVDRPHRRPSVPRLVVGLEVLGVPKTTVRARVETDARRIQSKERRVKT